MDKVRMDNPDIFFIIAVRLDNETLLKLLVPEFRDMIMSLLANNSFWYERCNWLMATDLQSRPSIEWRRVYRTLNTTINAENNVWSHLDYLPSISVLEELYGIPYWYKEDQSEVWSQIKTSEVLLYMIDNGYVEATIHGALDCLSCASLYGLDDLIVPLLDIIHDNVDDSNFDETDETYDEIEHCAHDAARYGHLSVLQILLAKNDIEDNEFDLLYAAVEGGHIPIVDHIMDRYYTTHVIDVAVQLDASEVLSFIIDKTWLDPESGKKLFKRAVNKGAPGCVKLLISLGVIDDEEIDWKMMLDDAISSEHYELVEYILRR
jgi:hypothetical protein